MAYTGFVVEITELKPIEKADKIQVATVFNTDVVVGMDVQIGDVMIYFPSDGQLSEKYAEANNLVRKKDANGENIGGYLDPDRRNIKAIKLRGVRSDGILMPLSSLYPVVGEKYVSKHLAVGDTIDVVNGELICQKYVPKTAKSQGTPRQSKGKSKKKEHRLFPRHFDTSQLAYSLDQFKEGDEITMTLKMHGTSARIGYLPEEKTGFVNKLVSKFGLQPKTNWGVVSGSRRVVLDNFDGGFYGSNGFRKKYHELFDGKLRKGEVVYGEIVGYVDKEKTIMPTVQNKKLKDKAFLKKYGETTTFSYGCEPGESDFYVYRMTMTNEDGDVVEYPTWLAQLRCEQMGVKHVPVIKNFKLTVDNPFLKNKQLLMTIADKFAEGTDPIGLTHIKEGIVYRIENREKFTAFKHKSFEFKVLEGIIKEEALEPDMEEADGE